MERGADMMADEIADVLDAVRRFVRAVAYLAVQGT